MEEGATLVNAVVGAVVSVVGSAVVPFAPVLGGAVAGYLEGGSPTDGVRVGFVSGLIALVPGSLLSLLAFGVLGSIFLGMGPGTDSLGVGQFSLQFATLALVAGVVFVVGCSTAGGWVGNYIKHETNLDL